MVTDMTKVRLGYVAMSVHLQNCSPSQTMTWASFQKIKDRDAAIRKLERIAVSNLNNVMRLLKHNKAHDINFFRFSSRLIPLVNHEELKNWNYMDPLYEILGEIGNFIEQHAMRIDFHPDHFVLLNSPDSNVFKRSLITLDMHESLLIGMGVDPEHRCVLHVGGGYGDKEKALEQFIHNWGFLPHRLQRMIMLENDDTTFTLDHTLYLCEKLNIPLVFDLHHHMANNEQDWKANWGRILSTWKQSKLPIKMHISSPRNEKDFRAHNDFVDPEMFINFLNEIKGTVEQIDCMVEAKQKDAALFRLMEDLQQYSEIEKMDGGSFFIR